jgi:hypothetical protein
MIGKTLAHYHTAQLDSGGISEVYKAEGELWDAG